MATKEKIFDYKQSTPEELNQRLFKTQEDLFKLRFRASTAPVKNTMQIGRLRKEVARIKTYLNQRRRNP